MFQYRFDDLLVLNKADNPLLPLAFWAGKGVHFEKGESHPLSMTMSLASRHSM